MAPPPSNGRRRLPRAAAGTLTLALCSSLLAGCGGSSKASGPDRADTGAATTAADRLPADQPQRAACGLLTQAEVQAAIGTKVGPGKEDMQPGRSLCSFPLASGTEQNVIVVSTSSSGVPAAFDVARSAVPSPQPVSAGDQAFVSGAQALVRKGDTMVAILVAVRRPPADLTAAASKLAQAVATHF